MVTPHTPLTPERAELDDDLETFAILVTKTRGDKRMRAEVRALMVSTLTERLVGREKDPRSVETRNKIAAFVDSFLVASERKDFKDQIKQDGALGKKFAEILEASGIDARGMADAVKRYLKQFVEECGDLARRVLTRIEDTAKDEASDPVRATRRRSTDASPESGLAIPKLIGGTAAPVSILITDKILAAIASGESKANQSVQEEREYSIKKLFPDPFKIPEVVKSSFHNLGTLTEAQYATVYDRALYVAIELRRDEQDRATAREHAAQMQALAAMRK